MFGGWLGISLLGLVLAPAIALAAFGIEVLNGGKRFLLGTGIREIYRPAFLLVLLVMFYWWGAPGSPFLAYMRFAASVMFALGFVFWEAVRVTPATVRQSAPVFQMQHWLTLSLPFMFNSLIVLSLRRAGILLLEVLPAPEGSVGLYATVAVICSLLTVMIQPTNSYFPPRISPHLKAGQSAEVNALLRRRFYFFTLAGLGFVAVVVIWGQDILRSSHPDCVPGHGLLIVFALGAGLAASLAVAPILLQFLGHNRLVLKMHLGLLIATLGLASALVPFLDAMGAARSYLVPFFVMLAWQAHKLAKAHGVRVIPWLR